MIYLEKGRTEQRFYEAYTCIVSEIINRFVNPELQEQAGFVSPKDKYSTSTQILGFRDGLELFNRLIIKGKLIKKKGKKRTREEKILEIIKYLKNLNGVGMGNANKTIMMKPFCNCKKCCKKCLIWNALACFACAKSYAINCVVGIPRAYGCPIF